jgi:hypothetical protein
MFWQNDQSGVRVSLKQEKFTTRHITTSTFHCISDHGERQPDAKVFPSFLASCQHLKVLQINTTWMGLFLG